MANQSNDPNAGGSMIADPRIADDVKQEKPDTCFFDTTRAVKKITNLANGDFITTCDPDSTMVWCLLEALGVSEFCEISDL